MIRINGTGSGAEVYTAIFNWPSISSTGNNFNNLVFNHNVGKKISHMFIESTSVGYRPPFYYRNNSQAFPAGTRRNGWLNTGMTDNSVSIRLYSWFSSTTECRIVLYFFDEEE